MAHFLPLASKWLSTHMTHPSPALSDRSIPAPVATMRHVGNWSIALVAALTLSSVSAPARGDYLRSDVEPASWHTAPSASYRSVDSPTWSTPWNTSWSNSSRTVAITLGIPAQWEHWQERTHSSSAASDALAPLGLSLEALLADSVTPDANAAVDSSALAGLSWCPTESDFHASALVVAHSAMESLHGGAGGALTVASQSDMAQAWLVNSSASVAPQREANADLQWLSVPVAAVIAGVALACHHWFRRKRPSAAAAGITG